MSYLLSGLCFEPSGFDAAAMYVNVFVQPLFVPCDHVVLSYGHRLKGEAGQSGWTITSSNESAVMADILAAMQSDGISFMERIKSPAELATHIVTLGGLSINPHDVETVSYALVLDGKYDEAMVQLRHLQEVCEQSDPAIAWPREINLRGNRVLKALRLRPADAHEMLESWRAYTIGALKLERVVSAKMQ